MFASSAGGYAFKSMGTKQHAPFDLPTSFPGSSGTIHSAKGECTLVLLLCTLDGFCKVHVDCVSGTMIEGAHAAPFHRRLGGTAITSAESVPKILGRVIARQAGDQGREGDGLTVQSCIFYTSSRGRDQLF